MTDNYELLSEALGKAADLQRELDDLRALITAWADADDDLEDVDGVYHSAWLALRNAVGR